MARRSSRPARHETPQSAATQFAITHVIAYAVPCLIVAVEGFRRRWVAEDAYIDLRVVEQIVAGHGPVFNAHERVEAYTSPLWVAILTVWRALHGPLAAGAVAFGLALTVGGLLAAQLAAARLRTGDEPVRFPHARAVLLPLGALVVAVIPAVWDFTTSGLESGLAFGWLGGTYLALVASATRGANRADVGAKAAGRWPWFARALLVGFGPLVRPDLTIMSAGFLLLLLLEHRRHFPRERRARLALVGAAFLPAVAYQIFRMGYFAALVANPAIAKEAARADWTRGWMYLRDFVGVYRLWVPVVTLIAWLAITARGWRHMRSLFWIVPVFCGLLHALYVVRVGGDFMHGRLFLPSLFCLLLPVMVIDPGSALRRGGRMRIATAIATAVVLVWALACALRLRVPYAGGILTESGIADERGFYARTAHAAHPVTPADYAAMPFAEDGRRLAALAATRSRVLRIDLGVDLSGPPQPADPVDSFPLPRSLDDDIVLVVGRWNIGLAGYIAGPHVQIVDRLGLSDPLAARLAITTRGRAGHEKTLANEWIVARWTDAVPTGPIADAVVAARHALDCGDLAELRHAIADPLTPGRFARNLLLAPKLTALRISDNPFEAERAMCR
jgi:arabinofuranosyltransferase